MTSWNALMVGLFAGALAACTGDMSFPDTGNGNDSGTDVVVTDTARDTGATGSDVVDAGGNSDVVSMTDGGGGGTCGSAALSCLCACGMNATCQQGCLTAQTCQQCVLNAQTMCCPSEAAAFATCAMQAQMDSDAGPACTTSACVQARCPSEVSAFQTCVNTASSSNTTCQGYLGVCFGSYPITCP